MKTCLSILLFCLHISLFAQTTWHVHADAAGAATGLSWTNAFTDLHLALDQAQPGDEVWVAQGLYRTDTAANRERYFDLPSGVRLLGGFNGTETSANQSDPVAYPTILSGNIGNAADSLDNAYCVLYLFHPDSSTLVDGVIVEHGFADKAGGSNQEPGRSGAGVFVYGINGAAWPVFRNCLIRHNFAKTHGGGFYINGVTGQGNTPLLRFCTFFNNRTELGSGAALYWTGGSNFDRGVELEDCVFDNNISGFHAGALFISKTRSAAETVNIRRCTFTGNKAISWGGVCMYNAVDSSFRHRLVFDSCVADNNLGRAGSSVVHFFNTLPTRLHFEMLNCRIQNFQPTEFNGLIEHEELFFAEILSGDRDSFIFRNNTFANNITSSPFFNFLGTQAHLVLENNKFLNNQGPNGGTCRMVEGGGKSLHVANNLFYANRFRLYSSAQRVEFLGNIVAGNRHARQVPLAGENLPMLSFNTPHNDSIRINNNLFANNICQPEVTATPLNTGKLYLYNNIFYNNKHAVTGQHTVPIWRDTTYAITNIIDFDNCSTIPNLLCFPSNLHQPNLMLSDTTAGDYRLTPCSPGIHAGNNAAVSGLLTDFLGNPRITGPAVDIGPYEDPLTGLSAEYLIEPSCANLSTGSLTFFTGNNGCLPYEVSWNNEGPFDGLTAAPLPAGPVSVTLTDGVGRTLVVHVTVPLTPSPQLISVVSHASSATTADGAVVVEPTAGSGPFQYLWSTGDTTSIIGGLLPGVYTLTLTDASGCQYTYAYDVSFNISTTEHPSEMPAFWPNPASNLAQVRWNGCDVLEVYSMQGQKLANLSGTDGNQFQVGQLPAGLYQVVFLKKGRMVHRSRLVVVR